MEPWHGVVEIPEQQVGDYKIAHRIVPAGEQVTTSNMRTALFRGQVNENLSFEKDTVWHELSYEGGVWMTDLPIEQIQHDEELADMEGCILVGGLGVGYAANVLAARPSVDKVVVVEISPEVCKMVTPHIKDPRGVVEVVNEDLFTYVKRCHEAYEDEDQETLYFDHAFYDIWQSDGEGTFHSTVVPLRRLSDGWVDNVVCWNEVVMRSQLAQGLHSRWMAMQAVKQLTMANAPSDMFEAWSKAAPKLEQLTKPLPGGPDVYWDWAIPFWQAVQEGVVNEQNFSQMAGSYAGTYGRGSWKMWWSLVRSGDIKVT